jgi:hypothetical protein
MVLGAWDLSKSHPWLLPFGRLRWIKTLLAVLFLVEKSGFRPKTL